jgi:hypothetical protein
MGKDHIKRVNQLKEKRNSRNDSDEEAALTKYAKLPVCCGSGMFIPGPGSDFFPSRIRIKEFNYFNPKKWFLSSK